MKILIYWEQSAWGGVDSHLLTLLNTWPDCRDEFIIVHNKGNKGVDRIKNDIRVEQNKVVFRSIYSSSYNECKTFLSRGILKVMIPIIYILQPILLLVMSLRLYWIFRGYRPKVDVLFADNGGYPGAQGCMAAIIAARWSGIRSKILMVHHAASKHSIFLLNYEKLLDRFLLGSVDSIICPSYATRQSLLDFRFINEEHVKIQVIHNGILIHNSRPARIPEVLNIEKKISIGIVGRIEPYKGHEDVITALAMLPKDELEKVQLFIVGTGEKEEIDRLRRLAYFYRIEERVIFTGYIGGDAYDIVSAFDIVLSATRTFEGFGLVIAESLAAGVPVIATRVGAVGEVFGNFVTLVNPVSPRDIKEALTDFMNDPGPLKEKSMRGKEGMEILSAEMALTFRNVFEVTGA